MSMFKIKELVHNKMLDYRAIDYKLETEHVQDLFVKLDEKEKESQAHGR